MTTGLFSNRTGNSGLTLRAHNRRERADNLNRFADFLAEGLSTEATAARLGFSASYGRVMLAKLKAGLGAQAC